MKYATKVSNSLVRRFTVTADVITFYLRGREQENFGASAISYFIKPCAQLYQTPAYLQTKVWIELAKAFQNAKPNPEVLNNPFIAAIAGSLSLASMFLSEYSLEIDTTSDYFSVEDINAAKAVYAEYYHQHKTKLEMRYQQLQKDMLGLINFQNSATMFSLVFYKAVVSLHCNRC